MYRNLTRREHECDWCFIPMKRVSGEDYNHYYECPRCKHTIPGEKEFDEDDILYPLWENY